jgi:hypothetical protein
MRNRILCLFTNDLVWGIKKDKTEIFLHHYFSHVYFPNLRISNFFHYPRLSQLISTYHENQYDISV